MQEKIWIDTFVLLAPVEDINHYSTNQFNHYKQMSSHDPLIGNKQGGNA